MESITSTNTLLLSVTRHILLLPVGCYKHLMSVYKKYQTSLCENFSSLFEILINGEKLYVLLFQV